VVVGSKKFTESVILGEVAAQLVRDAGVNTQHKAQLGGTRILWNALRKGDIDVYAEYTGTLRQDLLAGATSASDEALKAALARMGLQMSAPLGFDNSYVVGVREDVAERLQIRRISDLVAHPTLRCGFSEEFIHRADGWESLRERYRLPQTDVRGVDHDLAYRGLASGTLDVVDLYATDAARRQYPIRALIDDLHHFPDYRAVWLMRADLAERSPAAATALERSTGAFTEDQMVALNARVRLEHVPEGIVAAQFLSDVLKVHRTIEHESAPAAVLHRTREHLELVSLSLLAAILVAIPLGVFVGRSRRLGAVALALAGVIQTVPSLVILVLMVPLLGIGGAPAIAALFLYSLLPIVQNTAAGLKGIAPELRDSAEVLGLSPSARLWRIDLPLAAPSIMAGIKTSAVINVGTATLGAIVGAGGYGQPILTGIRLDDAGLILQGAVPAAAMALFAQLMFDRLERWLVPRGLR
jgi:osmoprotectant transport system permease protein